MNNCDVERDQQGKLRAADLKPNLLTKWKLLCSLLGVTYFGIWLCVGCGSYPDVYVVNTSDRAVLVEMDPFAVGYVTARIPPKTSAVAYRLVSFRTDVSFKDAVTGKLLATKHLDEKTWRARCPENTLVLEYPPMLP